MKKPYAYILEQIVRRILFLGIFLVPLIPLLVSKSLLFPFVVTKGLAFRALVEILFGLWIVLMILHSKYRPKRSLILVALFGFLMILLIADLQGAYWYRSFWSNYERMEGLIGHLHLLAFFLVISSVLQTEQQWSRFFKTSILVSVVISVYALLQKAGVFPLLQSAFRLEGTLGNASFLAAYVLLHLFLVAFFMFSKQTTPGAKRMYGLVLVLHLLVLYFTGTRGAMVGLIGSLMIISLVLLMSKNNTLLPKKMTIAFLIVMTLAVGSLIMFRNHPLVRSQPILSRFSAITGGTLVSEQRLYLWQAAWEAVKARPIFGWGQENFNIVADTFYNPAISLEDGWFDRAHNVIFGWLVSSGWVGLLSYLSIFLALFYYLIRDKRKIFSAREQHVFTGLLLAYFLQNLFTFDSLPSYIVFFSIVAYVHVRVVNSSEQPTRPLSASASSLGVAKLSLIAGSVIIIGYLVYIVNAPAYLANKTARLAITRPDQTVTLFRKALAYDSYGQTEVREQAAFAALKAQEEDSEFSGRKELLDLAIAELQTLAAQPPVWSKHLTLLGDLMRATGRVDEALELFRRAQTLAPARKDLRITLGLLYLQQKKYNQALEFFKDLYELEVRSGRGGADQYKIDNAMLRYVAALIYAGHDEPAENLLLKRFNTILYTDSEYLILNAYAARGRYDRVLAVWQEKLRQEPDTTDYMLSLAATYYKLGRTNEAIATINRVIELVPTFKDRGAYYIEQIKAGRDIEWK